MAFPLNAQPEPPIDTDLQSFFNANISGATYDSIEPVSEPGTMLLLGAGLICLGALGRKKFLKQQGRTKDPL